MSREQLSQESTAANTGKTCLSALEFHLRRKSRLTTDVAELHGLLIAESPEVTDLLTDVVRSAVKSELAKREAALGETEAHLAELGMQADSTAE